MISRETAITEVWLDRQAELYDGPWTHREGRRTHYSGWVGVIIILAVIAFLLV